LKKTLFKVNRQCTCSAMVKIKILENQISFQVILSSTLSSH
jgi:hypothetical protein